MSVERVFHRYERYLLISFALVAFLVPYQALVFLPRGDAWGTTITAQQIINHAALQIDPYIDHFIQNGQLPFNFVLVNGHYYHFYPPGTALLIAPLVGIANLFGLDMLQNDALMQKLLLAWSVALTGLLLYRLARCHLARFPSYLLAIGYTFGSSVASTMGTALWAQNLTTLLVLGIVLYLERYEVGQRQTLNPFLLGGALFFTFLCRPTGALVTIGVLIYLLYRARTHFLPTTIIVSVLASGFIIYNLTIFSTALPPYYLLRQGNLHSAFLLSTRAQLVSPSRGLFVFQPYLLFGVLGSAGLALRRRLPLLLLCGLGCICANLVPLASLTRWWAGWSYGSRFFTEFSAFLFLALVISWNYLVLPQSKPLRFGLNLLLAALFGVAVWMNTCQGLYNEWVQRWNGAGSQFNIDEHPQYIFSWKYPQYLASPELVTARNLDLASRELPTYPYGTSIGVSSRYAVYDGWFDAEQDDTGSWRWSNGQTARIWFRIGNVDPSVRYTLLINGNPYPSQTVTILLNGSALGDIRSVKSWPAAEYTFRIDPAWMESGMMNVIEIRMIDPVEPAPDGRLLGFYIEKLEINSANEKDRDG